MGDGFLVDCRLMKNVTSRSHELCHGFVFGLCTLALGIASQSIWQSSAYAFDLGAIAKEGVGSVANKTRDKAVAKLNAKLLAEGRKNQCSFKTDSDQLEAGCDKKVRSLANTLAQVKENLKVAGVTSFRFEVSGHTDTSGAVAHNKELSAKRAAVIAKELVGKGVPANEITSIGAGSERPLVKPDNTPAKKAKNRRYEIQIRF